MSGTTQQLTAEQRMQDAQDARSNYYHELMNAYREKSANLSGRKVDFLRKEPGASLDFGLLVGGGAVAGAITGGITGAITGGVLAGPAAPAGMALGASIGVPVGFVLGGMVGAGVATVYLRPRYEKFCRSETGREFGEALSVLISDETQLTHLKCPLTKMPVIEGMRGPTGQLYEKSAILTSLKYRQADPMTGLPMTIDDLEEDEEASFESNKAFVQFLVSKRQETLEVAPKLIEGYDALIKDIREAAIEIYNIKMAVLQKQLSKDKITYEEFVESSRELGTKYFFQ